MTELDLTSFGITKEFVERALNKKWGHLVPLKVKEFNVSKGSEIGDGYTTTLLTIQVWLEHVPQFLQSQLNWYKSHDLKAVTPQVLENEPISLIVKCYPKDVAQQEFLERINVFPTEFQVYDKVVPALVEFQHQMHLPIVNPPFPPFIAGQALTTSEIKELKLTRPLDPLDNYLILLDIRHHGNFHLRDRFLGFDLDHYKLVIETQAQLHALSWAYKCHTKLTLRSIFPALQKRPRHENTYRRKLIENHVEVARTIVKSEGGNSQILQGLDDLVANDKIMTALSIYADYDPKFDPNVDPEDKPLEPYKFNKDNILRVPQTQVENEEPWLVLLHGDAWSNNMMFRYDKGTNKPVQVTFLDLQISREGDPMCDIVYALYTTTTKEFRAKHLNFMLHLYFDKFNFYCQQFKVPTLPQFTWQEFMRRLHRAKFYGLGMTLMVLPIDLKKPELIVPLGSNGESKVGFENLAETNRDSNQFHPAMRERLSGMLEELTLEGMI